MSDHERPGRSPVGVPEIPSADGAALLGHRDGLALVRGDAAPSASNDRPPSVRRRPTPRELAPVVAWVVAMGLALGGCDGQDPPLIDGLDGGPDAGPAMEDGGADAQTQPVDSGPLPRVDSGTDAGPSPTAYVRFVHAAPDLAPVDFRAAEWVVAHDVTYRAATPYREVGIGEARLEARADDGEELARSESHDFADGERYLAVLVDPADGDPEILLLEDTAPDPGDELALRVLNATYDTDALDVDLDGLGDTPDVDDLAAGAASEWSTIRSAAGLRPVVEGPGAVGLESFTVDGDVAPWLEEQTHAVIVVVGHPADAVPSDPRGLSLLLLLEATTEGGPAFVLRTDPRLAILQASAALPVSAVAATPEGARDATPLTRGLGFGELLQTVLPPGRSRIELLPEGARFGKQVDVDMLAGHRYLMVTRGDPDQWGDARLTATILRDGLADGHAGVVHASLDVPSPMRWYTQDSTGVYAPVADLEAMAYGDRGPTRGVALDPSRRLALVREDRTEPNVWFEAPGGTRGFVVLAGSYFADPLADDALVTFWVEAPARGAWSVTRAEQLEGSGPLPDEPDPGGGVGI